MNKFHIPSPFSPDIVFPGNVVVINAEDRMSHVAVKRHGCSLMESAEMEISSGNESEISGCLVVVTDG